VVSHLLIASSSDGLNGRLPNQDLFNSISRIAQYTAGVPVVLYDHLDSREFGNRPELENFPSWVPKFFKNRDEIQEYMYQAKNVFRHIGYQARGRASGVHGLFHQ